MCLCIACGAHSCRGAVPLATVIYKTACAATHAHIRMHACMKRCRAADTLQSAMMHARSHTHSHTHTRTCRDAAILSTNGGLRKAGIKAGLQADGAQAGHSRADRPTDCSAQACCLFIQPKHAVCSFSPSMLSVLSAQACCLFIQPKHAVCLFSPSMLSVHSAQACCLYIQPKRVVRLVGLQKDVQCMFACLWCLLWSAPFSDP